MPQCPRCQREAPRIVRWKSATGDKAECPACLYPPYREGGTWHYAMPPKDLAWYETRGLI
jgi:hypothetical protein